MNETMLNQMRTLLDAAKKIIKTPDPISDINLFSILGMEDKEVSAHSAFLYYILKPFVGLNGKTDAQHLKLFLKYLRETQLQKTGTSAIPEKPVHVDIYREYVTDEGRLDFFIVFDRNAAVVELKIWAGEQAGQITRYREFLQKNGFNCDNVFFLTPTGWNSTTGQSISISLQKMAEEAGFFDQISELRKENGDYVLILKQYSSLIKKLTEDGSMEDLIKVFKKPTDIEAVDKLNDARKIFLAKLMEDLLWKIHDSISKDGILDLGETYPVLRLCPDAECLKTDHIRNYYQSGKSSAPGLCYRVEDSWLEKLQPVLLPLLKRENIAKGKKGEADLFFFIEIESDMFAGFSPRLQTNDIFDGGFVEKEDKELLKKLWSDIKSSGWYWAWDWVYFDNHTISFRNYLDGFLSLLDDNMEFDPEIVSQIGGAIKTICRTQCMKLFNI